MAAIAGKGLTNRQVGQLYAAWREGLPAIRERVLTAPLLFLKARQAVGAVPDDEGRALMDDLDMLAAVARRARRRLRQGVFRRLLPPERQEVHRLGGRRPRGDGPAGRPTARGGRRSCWTKRVRHAILELHRRGQGVRAIARALQVSRAAVRDVLRRGSAEVPRLPRPEKALEHREDILRLLQQCEGSFTRVHEELTQSRTPALLSGPDRLLPPPWDRPGPQAAGGALRLRAGPGDAARHLAA